MDGRKKTPLMGLVGGIGVVVALGGVLGLYPLTWAIFLAFAVWIIGATLVNVITR